MNPGLPNEKTSFVGVRLCVAFLFIALDRGSAYSQQPNPPQRYHPSHVVVRFKTATVAGAKDAAHAEAQAIGVLREYHVVDGLQLVEVPEGQVANAIASYKQNPNVLYAEPDHLMPVAETIPNDPYFTQLWGLHNPADTDIDAPEAWNIWQGGPEFLIGVADTGVYYDHPDFFEDVNGNGQLDAGEPYNIWINPGETGLDEFGHDRSTNGVDDDNNGCIDDVHGCNFLTLPNPPNGDVQDHDGHGTHVAGIIAAVGNNHQGVVGVNWRAKIVALKICTGSQPVVDHCSSEAAAAAIQYCIDNHIRVSNHSWGGTNLDDDMQHLKNVISASQVSQDELGHILGHVFVAAAGNRDPLPNLDNDISPVYPASFIFPPQQDNIIAVAATNSVDGLWSDSHYGQNSVDLGAPGVDIFSTVLPTYFPPLYGYKSGTSMAAPHVTGVVALVWSRFPDWTWDRVRNRVLDTVRKPVASLVGKTVTGGVVNAYRAIDTDCNNNGIYDPCDIACGLPGGACDVAGCGKSADCTGYKNDCCVTHATGGCADSEIAFCVCSYFLNGDYPYAHCCDDPPDYWGIWDQGCVDVAASYCPVLYSASCPRTPDGIPDECQPNGDCNGNGIHDVAESLARPVADSAGFLSPGSGSCTVGAGCNLSCHPLDRNRSLSFRILPSNPRNPAVQTAIRVSLVHLQNPNPANAEQYPPQNFGCWEVGAACGTVLPAVPPVAACTGTGESVPPTPGPTPASGQGGCARWVGKPGTFYESQGPPLSGPYRAARLQCTPCYDNWGAETAGNVCVGPRGPFNTGLPCTTDSDCLSSCTRKKCSGTPANTTCTGTGQGSCPAGQWCDLVSCLTDADCAAVGADTCDHTSVTCKPKTITVLGAEIMPSSTYDVQVFAKGCDGHEGTCGDVSCPLQITTARYGDVEAPFNPPSTLPQPTALDLCQIVYAGQGRVDAPVKARAQLQPNLPELNTDVNALDIVAVVDAIKGKAYPFQGPCPCPSLATCNALACAVPGTCTSSALSGLGPGALCVKTCVGGTNPGEPCINSTHCGTACVGGTFAGFPCDNDDDCFPDSGGTCRFVGTCGNGGATPGFCRDKCGRCK